MISPEVIVESHGDFETLRTEHLVYLKGFKERFAFSFALTDAEIRAMPNEIIKVASERLSKAVDVITSDWIRAGKPDD